MKLSIEKQLLILLALVIITLVIAPTSFMIYKKPPEIDPLRIEGVYGEPTMGYPVTYETYPGWGYHEEDGLWLPTILKPVVSQPIPQWGWAWEVTGPRVYFGGSNENQNRPALSPRFTPGPQP